MEAAVPTALAVPYLEKRHADHAARVRSWCTHNAGLLAATDPVGPRCTAIVRSLGEHGLLSFLADVDQPWDFRTICLSRDLLAHADDLADFAYSIQSLSALPLAVHGSAAQRARHLPELASGRQIGSFAISEPDAGSDLAAISTVAERTADGWTLNGTKSWIANAPTADLHTVIARTGGAPGVFGLSAFLVPAGTPGLVVEPVELLAARPLGDLVLTGCRLPPDAILGRPGDGFVIAMTVLERSRMTVGAAAVALARRAAEVAQHHAGRRRLGTRKLIDLDTARASLADMQTQLSAAWLLVLHAAWQLDTGCPGFVRSSSMAKLYATETAQQVVDGAVQLLGAAGVVAGSITEQLYRQVRLLRIYEGTSEVQRATIAGQLDFAGLTATGAER
jgi:acyl-CoA dehydrogenase